MLIFIQCLDLILLKFMLVLVQVRKKTNKKTKSKSLIARVRDLFKQARKSKSAIIFIDEIDAIGKPRDSGPRGGNEERESTLNQLLVELDGFTENENIIIFASTNVSPEDLDPALLRPGRFDRQISIDKPDQSGRVEIYKIHMKPIKVGDDISPERLAEVKNNFKKKISKRILLW